MTTTWTAVFTLRGMKDDPADVAQSINGLGGARLNRALAESLIARGWRFNAATPEDHGWHADAPVADGSKRIGVHLVTCPELDEMTEQGGALEDRWRIVIGVDIGILADTKRRRLSLLGELSRNVETACRDLGAEDFTWEVGGARR